MSDKLPDDEPPYPAYTVGTAPEWNLIPYHMRGGLRRYIEHGIRPGSFLFAVITNDLRGACGYADEFNKRALWDWMYFLYNYCPANSWGGVDEVSRWLASGGIVGQERTRAEKAAKEADNEIDDDPEWYETQPDMMDEEDGDAH